MVDDSSYPQRLSNLSDEKELIVGRLRLAADQLEASGQIDIDPLRDSVVRYRDSFGRLADELGFDGDVSLSAMDEAISTRAIAGPAIEVLDRVASVGRSDEAVVPAVENIRRAANQLKETLNGSSTLGAHDLAVARELTEGRHPFAQLLVLIEEPNALDDEAWTAHVDSIRDAFGSDLATSVIRGRLTILATESIF